MEAQVQCEDLQSHSLYFLRRSSLLDDEFSGSASVNSKAARLCFRSNDQVIVNSLGKCFVAKQESSFARTIIRVHPAAGIRH